MIARSRINFKDMVGRSALMFAVENKNDELIKLLLCFHANPIARNSNGKGAIEMTEDITVINMLNRSACMRAGLMFISGREQRLRFWKREILSIFDSEGEL